MTINAVQKALTRNQLAKTIVAHPEEAGRLFMRHDEVVRYTTEASGLLNNVPAYFVFNMDESGINETSDAKANKVLVHFGSN